MNPEELDKIYKEIEEYDIEVGNHNDKLISSFGKTAKKHFVELVYDCCVSDKIEIVDKPSGKKQNENAGIFRNIHVEQWTTNMEGDSYSGYIYAKCQNKWLKIPYSC